MTDLSSLAKKLLYLSKTAPKKSCFVGFDGFTDTISSVVDKEGSTTKRFIKTLKNFGTRILHSSGKSSNFELVTKEIKLGGNAPIFTNALLKGGHSIIFAGMIGTSPHIEPIFQEMASSCKKVFLLGKSGKTDALEFTDGKLILGEMATLECLTYEKLIQAIPEKTLIHILNSSDLFACFNWTMLPHLTTIWQKLLKEIVPKISARKKMFIDLSDPSKRKGEALLEALHTLSKFNKKFDVILGLNQREAEIVCKLLKIPFSLKAMQKTAYSLLEKLKISQLIIHTSRFAISQDATDYFYAKTFYTKKPFLLTGAGDNFNAGYCNALLFDLSNEEALSSALATSGFYVRRGKSPTFQELAEFLHQSKNPLIQ